jgi:hypothetical protein
MVVDQKILYGVFDMDMVRMLLETYFNNGLVNGMLEQVEDYIKETIPDDKAQHMVDALYTIILMNRMPMSFCLDGGLQYYFSNMSAHPAYGPSLYARCWRLYFTKKVKEDFYSPYFKCPIDALMWAFEMLSDV